jgi:ech hydrogenase subunit F
MSVFKMTASVLANLFSRPATRLYPQKLKKPHHAPKARGRIGIDIETCIFCMLCQKRCPTDAIVVTRSAKEWNIDRLRCCACNACVEVCPVKCLWMEETYSPPTVTREKDYFRQKPKEPPAGQTPRDANG